MPKQRCAVCVHPRRDEIEFLLRTGEMSQRAIAAEFSIHRTQLRRHAAGHAGEPIRPQGQALREGEWTPPDQRAEPVPFEPGQGSRTPTIAKVEKLEARVSRALDAAEERGGIDQVVAVSREMRQNLELQAKLKREVGPSAAALEAGGTPIIAIAQFNLEPGADGQYPHRRMVTAPGGRTYWLDDERCQPLPNPVAVGEEHGRMADGLVKSREADGEVIDVDFEPIGNGESVQ